MKRSAAVLFFFLFFLGLVIYQPALKAGFVFDDYKSIVDNPLIKNTSSVLYVWQKYKTRFIPYFSFAVNYHFSPYNPFGFHLFNVVLHLINSGLVYYLCLLVFQSPPLLKRSSNDTFFFAAFCSVIFLVHPVQTQAVTYIVQRITVMAAFFYLLTLIYYLRFCLWNRKSDFIRALVYTSCAVMTKETTITIPIMLVMMECVLFDRPLGEKIRRTFLFFGTFLVIPFFLAKTFVQTGGVAGITMETQTISRPDYFLTQCHVLFHYFRLIIFPIGQNVDYDFPVVMNIFEGHTWLLLGILVLIIGCACLRARQNRLLSFGLFWFFIALSVESSIFPIKDVIQEHRLYLPLIGAAMTAASFFIHFVKRQPARYAIIVLFTLVFSVLTYQRNQVWQDNKHLWLDVIKKSPLKSRAYHNLGVLYLDEGRYADAEHYLKKSEELTPVNFENFLNLGVLYMEKENYVLAEDYYLKAEAIHPESAVVQNDLGTLYFRQDDYQKSEACYVKANELNPGLMEPRLNLANVYLAQGRRGDIAAIYKKNLTIDPYHRETLSKLLKFYLEEKDPEAKTLADKLLVNIEDAVILVHYAGLLAEHGLYSQSLNYFEKALKADPDNTFVYLELGKLFANMQYTQKAIQTWQQGLRIDPDDAALNAAIRKLQSSK